VLGGTFHPREVFASLIRRIEAGEVHPLVAATYPLAELATAQEHFGRKDFVGKIAIEVRST
jgi:NADPH:quinone reductase-like Zn-dependent oxidoreductase